MRNTSEPGRAVCRSGKHEIAAASDLRPVLESTAEGPVYLAPSIDPGPFSRAGTSMEVFIAMIATPTYVGRTASSCLGNPFTSVDLSSGPESNSVNLSISE